MVGTDPFTRVSVEAKPASYWPLLLKQSDVKWLAHTHKLTSCHQKIKCNHHCLFCSSVAGTEYRHWCWFLQPTTEQFGCLTLSEDVAKHCYLTAGHTELHLGDDIPLRYLTQRTSAYENLSFRYVTTWAESDHMKPLNLETMNRSHFVRVRELFWLVQYVTLSICILQNQNIIFSLCFFVMFYKLHCQNLMNVWGVFKKEGGNGK